MNGDGARSVLDLFHGARLTPTQRRIAHCLVEHSGKAAYFSAAEVADLAGVSQPSVTRFAMALGYEGYPALRRRLRDLTGDDSAEVPAAGGNAMQLAVRAEAEHLARLHDQLARLDDVERAARLLNESRPLPVLGLRAAAPLAGYFGYFAAKVHPDVRVLDTGGTPLLDRLDQARAAGAGAMLAVVLPRYPRESLDAIAEAKRMGYAVVAITDSAVSPVADHTDVVLPAAVGTQLVFDLHTGPMAMAMVLLQAMCDAAPEPAQRRLEEFEATAARRHIFTA
ncbi:MurR/RpiR family transcriptional regulator [Paractinoplanes globisporus]|uniref:MurR/RpiR family transcriptional regulator n=1 Tax=Paractinoplanes globisporus TaxID=113565 RepID=A0ABW6WD54_9ACTN|nr:MurR/RpiR family transcriptional regulator [Actinoplanes globisporus]